MRRFNFAFHDALVSNDQSRYRLQQSLRRSILSVSDYPYHHYTNADPVNARTSADGYVLFPCLFDSRRV